MQRRRVLLLIFSVVLALCVACGVWLYRERQQYTLNRQLIEALQIDDTEQALELVQRGADPNTRLQPPPVPSFSLLLALVLHRAAIPVNGSPTAFLLACGTDYEGHHTHCKDETRLVQAMWTHGGDLHARTTDGYTALEGAVSYSHPQVTAWLLKNGANPNEQYADGGTPLRLAASTGSLNMVRLLLRCGADVNGVSQDGRTALMEAAVYEHEPMARLLLEAGANVNQADHDGATALLLAAGERSLPVMRLLLWHGASVYAECNGWTPLREAVNSENPAMVQLLLAHHADLHCPDDRARGDELLTITYTHTQTPVKRQIRRLLRQAGAKREYER